MLKTLRVVIWRDLLLIFRCRSDALNSLFFFVIAVALFPLGIGPEFALLRTIAPSVIWVAALFASMLALNRLFVFDHADGTLEQSVLSSESLSLIVFGKIIAHWLASGLPLLIVTPLLAAEFDLDVDCIAVLMISLLLGTPVLSLIGSIGAALTLGTRNSNVLVSLLVLPLYIPTLIFGAGAVGAQASGLAINGHLMLLGGMLCMALSLAPWVTAAALRIAVE
ncbi:heme exporter protein CcmB [Ampullimonas aquatilis]|uniref:heme exporter protein CcmB n=1 Tax=Ampullimonas aquatilis TaxID=1341549 RepID=UPI003C78391B